MLKSVRIVGCLHPRCTAVESVWFVAVVGSVLTVIQSINIAHLYSGRALTAAGVGMKTLLGEAVVTV